MTLLEKLTHPFTRAFRRWYETTLNVPNGIARFIGNIAFIQLNHSEMLTLPPASLGMGEINVTSNDGRPMLTYKWWPKKMPYHHEMPYVQVIVELRGFQVRHQTDDNLAARRLEWDLAAKEKRAALLPEVQYVKDWTLCGTVSSQPCLTLLRDFFLAFAFYLPLSESNKRKRLEVV